MCVSGSTTILPHLPTRGVTQPSIPPKTRFSLSLDVPTRESFVIDAVFARQTNMEESDILNFISQIKKSESSSKEREKLARHLKYLEGISIAKSEHNVFGEAAHEFAESYTFYYFCDSCAIGKYIMDEVSK